VNVDDERVDVRLNAANATLATYEYGPFGEVIRATGPMAKLNPFTYQTEFCDWETDQYYCKHRYYNPSTGRWLSRDPLV
jgi:RHS repeat-associated protein